MQLKDFIKEALVNIFEGVSKAHESINKLGLGGSVNPPTDQRAGHRHQHQNIDFDIAVTISEGLSSTSENSASANGEIGGIISVVGLSGELSGNYKENKERKDSYETISRIKFHVSVAFPLGNMTEGEYISQVQDYV